MKEKKLIASVILGVALVSLITAIVAGLAEGIPLLADMGNLHEYKEDYNFLTGGLTLGGVALGAAFVIVFFVNKKHRFSVNLALAVAVVLYCLVTIIVLRIVVPATRRDVPYLEEYVLFTAYLTTAVTFIVSTALAFAAWLYLTLVKKKEEAKKPEPEETANQE